jgi:hypothetical protein
MLSTLPSLEMLALLHDVWAVWDKFSVLALAGDLCCIAWLALALLRLLHVFSIFLALHVFGFHFITGFFDPKGSHSFRGFWAEYCGAYMFAQLMLLAAVSSWFASPEAFYSLPTKVQAISFILAMFHGYWSVSFCIPNTLLCFRNVEYSEKQLAKLFDRMKFQEITFQTLLDLQLAFVRRVHLVLRKVSDGEVSVKGSGGVGKVGLLLSQIEIIVMVFLGTGGEGEVEVGKAVENTKVKKSSRSKSRSRSTSRGAGARR